MNIARVVQSVKGKGKTLQSSTRDSVHFVSPPSGRRFPTVSNRRRNNSFFNFERGPIVHRVAAVRLAPEFETSLENAASRRAKRSPILKTGRQRGDGFFTRCRPRSLESLTAAAVGCCCSVPSSGPVIFAGHVRRVKRYTRRTRPKLRVTRRR